MAEKRIPESIQDLEELHKTITLLFPEKNQRDFVNLFNRLTTDDQFRATFWDDPAGSLRAAKLKVDPQIVEALHGADRTVVDKMVSESRDLIANSSSFTWEGERVAIAPLAAAFLAGALAMRLYDDRWVSPRNPGILDKKSSVIK